MPVQLKHTNQKTGVVTVTDYVTVPERLIMARSELVGLTTEIVSDTATAVTVKATAILSDGRSASGHACSRKDARGIEGQAPLEVAETSAVGRCLGFLGFGAVDSIASAEEVIVAQTRTPAPTGAPAPAGDGPACEECGRPMLYRTGESARGPWRGYFCPQGKGCPGKPHWLPTKTTDDLAPDSEEVPFSA